MSKITSVRVTEHYVRVAIMARGREEAIRVETHRSIEDMVTWEPVQIILSGFSTSSIDEIREQHESIGEAIAVAEAMQGVIDHPDAVGQFPPWTVTDYMQALLVLVKGGRVFYERGREVEHDPERPDVLDSTRLSRRAIELLDAVKS